MFLTDEEIQALTKRTRRAAQSRVLTFLGIEHKPRPDGSLVVLRSHVEAVLGSAQTKPRRRTEPNFDAIK